MRILTEAIQEMWDKFNEVAEGFSISGCVQVISMPSRK